MFSNVLSTCPKEHFKDYLSRTLHLTILGKNFSVFVKPAFHISGGAFWETSFLQMHSLLNNCRLSSEVFSGSGRWILSKNVKFALYVFRKIFWGILFWEKIFQNYFQTLGENVRCDCQTYILRREKLSKKIFLRIKPFSPKFCWTPSKNFRHLEKIFRHVVKTAFYVSRGSFWWKTFLFVTSKTLDVWKILDFDQIILELFERFSN